MASKVALIIGLDVRDEKLSSQILADGGIF